MGSRARPSRRAVYGPGSGRRSRSPDWQFECRRENPEVDAFESFYRMRHADARVHAMGSPFREGDYGGAKLSQCEKPHPSRRRSGRRTHSMDSPESDSYTLADLFCQGDEMYDAFHSGRSGRPKGPWNALFSSLFSCVSSPRSSASRAYTDKRARELMELSRRQESALADKQDTIDILEWKLQQLHLFGQDSARWLSSMSKRFALGRDRDSPASELSEKGRFENYLAGVKLMDNDVLAVLVLFDTAVVRARIAVRCFCRIFMKQMELSGYAVWKALSDMEPRTNFARKEHAAFVLESHINKALYHSFESESFDEAGITKFMDPDQRCVVRLEEYETLKLVDAVDAVNRKHRLFDSDFLRFCDTKMREMWFLFPWNIVFHTPEQRAVFTGSFLDAAKNVWLLHRLAHSLNPVCTILRVGRGTPIDTRYVEVVAIPPYETCRKCVKPKVEFMTMPGFRAHHRVTKCQVYQHFSCSR